MSNQVKICGVCALGVALISGAANAAEKVQLRGSTTVELPKPARPFEESSRFKFDNSDTMDEASSFLPPPAAGNTGALDRKLKEIMDRKKNWIFENPYERKMDSRTMEILDKEGSSSPLLDHHLLQDEDKSAMQKFLEEKNSNRGSSEPQGNPGSEPRLEQRENGELPQIQGGFSEVKKEDAPVALFFGAENSFFKERESDFEAGGFERKMEKMSFERGAFGEGRFAAEAPRIDRESLARQDQARESEFTRVLQPGAGIGLASPTAEARLESALNPSLTATTRPDPGARRMDMMGSSTKVDFGGGSRASSLPSSLPSSGPEIGGASSFSSTPTFLPARTPTALGAQPAPSPQPFVFELPRRKF